MGNPRHGLLGWCWLGGPLLDRTGNNALDRFEAFRSDYIFKNGGKTNETALYVEILFGHYRNNLGPSGPAPYLPQSTIK